MAPSDPPSEASSPDPAGTSALQAELTREQDYLDLLYARLDELRDRALAALRALRAAPVVPTPGGRAERDAFDALHTERLAQLQAVEDRLSFGRLDLTTGQRRYIGRLGLSDDSQSQLLIDWRAPAAATFYQATAAAPGGVARRRHLNTKGRTVVGLDDELLDASALDDQELRTITGEGALMTALTAHRTGHMRDIVATLQAEQDQIVRAPLSGVLVVQGGPGTGKTAVALHRAAYLLYTHRDRIAKSGVLVVGPSTVFLQYIDRVLPSLGETGVVLATPGELFPGVTADAPEAPEVSALKGDPRMEQLIRNAVRGRQRLIDRTIPISIDGDRIVLRPAAVAEGRSRARQRGRTHNEARVTFVRHVLDDLAAQLARARRLEFDAETRLELMAELRDHRDVRREINLRWMPLTPQGLLARLFALPKELAQASAGLLSAQEQRLLLREPGSGWSQADVPLLDEAADLIGPDVTIAAEQARERARAAADRAQSLDHARSVLDANPGAAELVTAEMLADRFTTDSDAITVADRARGDRDWAFGHVVVDEAQEASPMLWRLLARRVPSRSMTVVGDLAQTSSAAGASSWAQMLQPIAPDRWQVRELTVNYRTPGVIMDPAVAMLRASGMTEVLQPRSAREGDWPPVALRVASTDPEDVVPGILAAIADDERALGGGQFAVILPRALRVSVGGHLLTAIQGGGAGAGLAPDRVSVLDVEQAKGLEFDSVIVTEPAAIMAESARGANDLYVALTRPTQRLTVVHSAQLPEGLRTLRLATGAPVT
jgi:DNA helicase IV